MSKIKDHIKDFDLHLQEPYIEESILDFTRWLLYKTQIGEFYLDRGNSYTPEEIYELYRQENRT